MTSYLVLYGPRDQQLCESMRALFADNRKRPDLEVRGFDHGILGDVIVIGNNPPTHCSNTSISDLTAAAAERVKHAEFLKYSPFETYDLWPLEALGRLLW